MRRWFLAAPALLLSFAAAAIAQEKSPLERALEAFREGNYGQVVLDAVEVPATDPDYPKAQYVLGEAWLAQGEHGEAERVFRALLVSKPESVPLLTGLGRALAGRKSYADAEEVLRKAARLDPRDPAPRRALGECLAGQQKPREAREELEAAAKLDPRDPLTARSLVEVTITAGDVGAAGKAAEAFRKSNPASPMGDFLVGLVLDRKGDPKGAIASYEAALEKEPKFLDAHKNLAILCVAENPGYKDAALVEKALKHFEKYFELGGEDRALRSVVEKIRAYLESRKKE